MASDYISSFISTAYTQLCYNCACERFQEYGIYQYVVMFQNVSQC